VKGRKTKVFVGMSGGVDSSLAAALLVEQGYDVTGVYMKNWTADLPGMKCPWAEDLADAKRVAVQLNIPFKVFDFQKEYKQKVVDYMIAEYQAGRTPNPDIMCNQEVKFKLFLDAALAEGADMIATGHYARIGRKLSITDPHTRPKNTDVSSKIIPRETKKLGSSPQTLFVSPGNNFITDSDFSEGSSDSQLTTTNVSLLRAKDSNKDQTYFLYRVTEEALQRTLFPLGDFTSKEQVRREAAERGLSTARKKDSQGICFVGSVGIRDFLSQFVETKPGDIIDQDSGQIIGRHDGAIFYTFGQRHGLGALSKPGVSPEKPSSEGARVGGGLPYYVVAKNMAKNDIYVSSNLNAAEFWRQEIKLTDVHWTNKFFASSVLAKKKYQIRVRHRAPLLDATFASSVLAKKELVLRLTEPERAIAPGQSVVIYDGEIVLGGGIVK